MSHQRLWDSHFVKLTVKLYGEKKTFDCDYRIAEVIKILNEKGYHTGNCCEGHPYKYIDPNGNKKYRNIAYFDNGYISFCSDKDTRYILSKLNEKCDYFGIVPRAEGLKYNIYWQPFKSIDIEGKSNTIMKYDFLVKLIRGVYEDIWRVLLETAQELPYKEGYHEH